MSRPADMHARAAALSCREECAAPIQSCCRGGTWVRTSLGGGESTHFCEGSSVSLGPHRTRGDESVCRIYRSRSDPNERIRDYPGGAGLSNVRRTLPNREDDTHIGKVIWRPRHMSASKEDISRIASLIDRTVLQCLSVRGTTAVQRHETLQMSKVVHSMLEFICNTVARSQ